ncbi:hypothetical protein [Synechococcus sp. BA-132 BA5]|uniref:hypothetical protein n=1 Tax=Synechococcus sp. BA-132 BA5 TaxID=3110252 RepID=UPI002B1EA1A3|nr:hypothetical protein [Synechococcus sp. BA-132 BA5]MEA5413709.1 hypothetical protein [Synechococcus sp. BA-132 BA5]
MALTNYSINIFVNCPFDETYLPLMEAIIFAIHDCGFIARSALEAEDSAEVRIEKIAMIIKACKYGIHDISRTEPGIATGLPRFNMPLELGLFLGARRFGSKDDKTKACLILDSDRYRYQRFCSDIAGQDIQSHDACPEAAIKVVRNWLRNNCRGTGIAIPGGGAMVERFRLFQSELPLLCRVLRLERHELIFNDYTTLIAEWLKENSWWDGEQEAV